MFPLGGNHLLTTERQKPRTGSKKARVTISDVADALGLAKGTVSRALNGYPDISEGTRARVRGTADRMGYSPMAHAQAIRTGRLRSLAIVFQMGEPDAQRPFLADFLAGVSSAASAEAWTLTVATALTEDETLKTMARLIDERKADGFILPRTKIVDPRINLLREAGVPFVLWGRTGDPSGCAWFDILGEDAVAEAVHRLHALGHRHIGFINGGAAYNYSALRLQGFLDAMAALGLPVDPAAVAGDAVTPEGGAAQSRRILSGSNPPTALICATDMAALGCYRSIEELGLQVGKHVSLVSYDGVPEGAYATPPLTTFEVDSRAAGERLSTLLIRLIRGEDVDTLRETAHAKLLTRSSDGPPIVTSKELRTLVRASRRPD